MCIMHYTLNIKCFDTVFVSTRIMMKYYKNLKKRCVYTKNRPIFDWHFSDNLRPFPSARVDNRDCIMFQNLYFSKWPATDRFSYMYNGKEMSLDPLITTLTGLHARWPGSHCLIPGRSKWFFFFSGFHPVTPWKFNITEWIAIEYNKSILLLLIMLHVSVLLTDHHPAQKYTYAN